MSSTATTLARPPLTRLTSVELRKMIDTRAGFWLQLGVVALTIAAVTLLLIFGDSGDRTLPKLLEVAVAPASVLLPIVGILLVSSEWSQRTALITFTLVPQRWRVVAAKVSAGVVLALVALAACLAVSLVATAVAGSGIGGTWSLPPWLLGQVGLSVAVSILIGIGFGAVLLSSAPAIVLSFVLPAAWGALGSIHALVPAARWLDPSRTMGPLTDHIMSTTEWGRLGTSLALWIAVPVLVGLGRITRSGVQTS